MHELHQWPAAADALQSAPVGIITKIRSSIARKARGQGVSLQRLEKAPEGCVSFPCGLAKFDRRVLRAMAVRIGKQNRSRVAGARLKANLPAAARESEDKEHVRFSRQ